MKKVKQLIGYFGLMLIASLFFNACNNVDNKTDTKVKPAESLHAMATLTATMPDTALTGTADFTTENGKVKLSLTLSIPAMANKSVAVHIHEMGDCGDMGKGAHGHWNPTNQQHGKWGTGSFHAGDIGNVSLDSTGKGTLQLETDLWTIGGDAKTDVLNHSIIVHSGMDDFTTQPTGNAGSRIGCGVIVKK
jgi:Cu-Zn family superoxide dismutase